MAKSSEEVNTSPFVSDQSQSDVLIIGAGLSGLVAAWRASAGLKQSNCKGWCDTGIPDVSM
jgi:hypothetical protein